MDVYCHPFTSGGQEIPVQEAKLTELITLVTNYSCGEDSCSQESGGIPLDWSEYREPGTQFIKATTSPSSILKGIKKVWKMKPDKRAAQGKKSRQFVLDNYDSSVIGPKLEKIIDDLPEVEWDFDFTFKNCNPNYNPPNIPDNSEWIIDLYKNILNTDVDSSDQGHQHWMKRLQTDMQRPQVLDYFRSVAIKENNENNKVDFGDIFIKNGRKRALMVCNGDLNLAFSATSLLDSFSETYPDTDLYVGCPPPLMPFFDGNPHVKKLIPYQDFMEDEFAIIGRGVHKGYVDHYINLGRLWLKNISTLSAYK